MLTPYKVVTTPFVTHYNPILTEYKVVTTSFVTYYKLIVSLYKVVTTSFVICYKPTLTLYKVIITSFVILYKPVLTPCKAVTTPFVTQYVLNKMISEHIKLSWEILFEVEIAVLVGPCQKRDIVDTFSHASRATWHIMYKQTGFPTVRRKAGKTLTKDVICYFCCILVGTGAIYCQV